MRNIQKIAFIIILGITFSVNAQKTDDLVSVGETFSIQESDNYQYSHINFPKPNFIIKKGAIADYKKLRGVQVVVSEIKSNKGKTRVVLKRKDGKKFFGNFPSVTANIEDAVASGELIR